MSKKNAKDVALELADELCNNHSANVLLQLASTLFQRTLEINPKNKWLSSEDNLISTFFYLSSKEELCEALQCDMESLYARARHLGVVAPSFNTLLSYDLSAAINLFSEEKTQEEVLRLFGIDSVTVPVKSLTVSDHEGIRASMIVRDSAQMELFDEV